MNNTRREISLRNKTLPIFLAMMILAGCSRGAVVSPSIDDGEAITQGTTTTIEIPTKTPVPTDTSPPPTNTPRPTDTPVPPTSTPVPTNTQAPTATPTLTPDSKAMIDWKELGLPSEYKALSPEVMSIQEGASAYVLPSGREIKISGSFLFANGEKPDSWVYGYTVLLPSAYDIKVFNQIINNIEAIGGYELTVIEDANGIGDYSKGATGISGNERITTIGFRIDNIGAVVFLRQKATDGPGIDGKHLTQVYAKSIEQPTQYCAITSAKAVPGVDIPTFEVEAEGFYPQEGRFIMLEGAIGIGGETFSLVSAKLGGTGETVDPDGGLSDVISIDLMQQLTAKGYKDVQLPEGPIEFTMTVGGHFSQCKATQTVTWP